MLSDSLCHSYASPGQGAIMTLPKCCILLHRSYLCNPKTAPPMSKTIFDKYDTVVYASIDEISADNNIPNSRKKRLIWDFFARNNLPMLKRWFEYCYDCCKKIEDTGPVMVPGIVNFWDNFLERYNYAYMKEVLLEKTIRKLYPETFSDVREISLTDGTLCLFVADKNGELHDYFAMQEKFYQKTIEEKGELFLMHALEATLVDYGYQQYEDIQENERLAREYAFYNEDYDDHFDHESDSFCPLCDASPCMCSDPDHG